METETLRPFSPPYRRAHPPGPERLHPSPPVIVADARLGPQPDDDRQAARSPSAADDRPIRSPCAALGEVRRRERRGQPPCRHLPRAAPEPSPLSDTGPVHHSDTLQADDPTGMPPYPGPYRRWRTRAGCLQHEGRVLPHPPANPRAPVAVAGLREREPRIGRHRPAKSAEPLPKRGKGSGKELRL